MNRSKPGPTQQGVSLLFALLALVALSLATLALVRTVDTGGLVLGNIGFKQDATVAGDQATRQAVAWLKANVAGLNADNANSGYYASTKERNADTTVTPVDATGQQYDVNARKLIDWDNDTACNYATSGSFAACALKTVAVGDVNGNKTRYVIFRLCQSAGDPNDEINNSCAKPLNSGSGASGRGAMAYGTGRFTAAAGPYYRVIVRVLGPRNTASFTETIVNFQ
ncbi:hypothetical protein H6CHR_05388 [Variovorax sp. PBL-H6]|uniref:pilus assembly protein PilX n=1 Tax=Variovorax sp. PBL-H6 TaxID=434009 RepID=UPI0013196F0F|nr:pilus assembly protein PilX [Variovorax sp. PBL-H6]VTU39092.1 hypothetical protein H6CHR_05388 [Variovorax sp. PBL-H6]